ncbi:MAG: dodecin family protein [Chitinophagales bacterium]|nr:dodecin domain-containing protein [Bacteroidota bacterium]
MSVLKVIELMASSDKSWEDATKTAISKASKTVKNIKAVWVKDQSVAVDKGKVTEFRVTLKASFEVS